jgi:ubiquinone biosynthesis protein Coq4
MKEKLIKTLDLENGLQLNVYDASRKLVGDRWLVSLIIRMDVPVAKALKKNNRESMEHIDEIMDMLGDSVLFEKKREKIFVDTRKKEIVFKELYDTFLNSSLNYLSKEIFPKQYVLKMYKEEMKKKSLLNSSRNSG